MKKNILAVIFVIVFSSIPAFTQNTIFVPRPPVINIYPQFDPVRMQLEREYLRQSMASASQKNAGVNGKKGGVAVSKSRSAVARSKAKSVTDFTSTGEWILPDRLSRTLGKTPAEVSEVKRQLNLFLHAYEKVATDDNSSPDDLSYGLSFFIVNNYVVMRDAKEVSPALKFRADESTIHQKAAFSDATHKIIHKQVKDSLTANPTIAKLTDRQKQELTEMMVIITVTNYYMYETAGKNDDAEGFAQAQNEAKQSLEKILGVSVDKITINYGGLQLQ